MSPSRILLILLRFLAGVQVAVGLTIWVRHPIELVPLHRASGVLFVLVLWSIAGLAIVGGRNVKTAIGVILWGVVIAYVGFMQQRFLPGDYHWIVRVAHLLIGLAPMPLADRLAPKRAPLP